jgi:EF hand domain-containing protein
MSGTSKGLSSVKRFFVSVALGAIAFSSQAGAQAPTTPSPATATPATPSTAPEPGGERGAWMRDTTRAQTQQMADALFQRLDLNHDGTVTRAEAEQAMAQFAASRGDGNGGARMQRLLDREFGTVQSLTQQQFEAQALARFDSMDLNHDGVVTAAERQQVRAQRQESRQQGKPERGQ